MQALVLILLVALCNYSAAHPNQYQAQELLNWHNKARAEIARAGYGQSMQMIFWDPFVSTVASTYTEACEAFGVLAGHNAARNTMYQAIGGSSQLGENWAAGGGACATSPNTGNGMCAAGNVCGASTQACESSTVCTSTSQYCTLKNRVYDAWYQSETNSTTHDCLTYAQGGGHCTQVTWQNSNRLGCGYAYCPGSTYSFYMTCNYNPPGNYGGQGNHGLNAIGPKCGACGPNMYCVTGGDYDGLCTPYNPAQTYVPGIPAVSKVTWDGSSATVFFYPNPWNGQSALTGFTVSLSNKNGGGLVSQTVSATASSVTFTGLTAGTVYNASLVATNAVGNSGVSPISADFKIGCVGPVGIKTVSSGNGYADVTFYPATVNGGSAVTSYVVVSSLGGTASAAPVAGNTQTIRISGISGNQTFTVYGVSATCSQGIVSKASPFVTIVGPPTPPTITVVTPAVAQATVVFTAPASNGGSPITGYTVTANPGSIVVSSATVVPVTVSGLTNGVAYSFVATATNALGTSASSNAVVATPVAPVGTPGAAIISGVVAGNGVASVSFTAPIDNGSPISLYKVTSNPGGIQVSANALTIVVTGLTNGQAYTFVVEAYNSNGWGAASASSASVTPGAVPAAPTISSVTAGNAQVTVAFNAGNNNGAPISSFTCKTTAGTFATSAASSPIVVTGLTNGVSYNFVCTATNSWGTSAQSSQSAAVVPSLPAWDQVSCESGLPKGAWSLNYCYFLGALNQDCNAVCAAASSKAAGGLDLTGTVRAGSGGSTSECQTIAKKFNSRAGKASSESTALGCNMNGSTSVYKGSVLTTATAVNASKRRVCACKRS